MRPDRFPKVDDVMLAEALRQLIPVADIGAHQINEKWAVGPTQRAWLVLDMWARQERGRKKKLQGQIPNCPRDFQQVADNPKRPDTGQWLSALTKPEP